MTAEHYEKRFGMIAVEKGYISPSQVLEAMEIQVKENMEKNQHRSLGELLVALGYMDKTQVHEVLNAMDIPL